MNIKTHRTGAKLQLSGWRIDIREPYSVFCSEITSTKESWFNEDQSLVKLETAKPKRMGDRMTDKNRQYISPVKSLMKGSYWYINPRKEPS